MTRDQELWAPALWVERNKGADGAVFVSEQIGRASLAGNAHALVLWREVARRLEALIGGETPPCAS